ncbi:hypothetical protein PENNAL_c0602G06260 [Penicillium nalgiovense]|uniref:Uncharacterized protein n=1 Tax=Penicillium nalgiovense TaxID=60175 RepID=A0A1V6VAU2_PENNA|nr:hypothetical protein PENNAL_c0602G06260 [Penicillium nalgiovense]
MCLLSQLRERPLLQLDGAGSVIPRHLRR